LIKDSEYKYNETQHYNYVQDEESYYARSIQLLGLATQLIGYVYVLESDEEGCNWIGMLSTVFVWKSALNVEMREVIKCDSALELSMPSLSSTPLKTKEERAAREEIRRKEEREVTASRDVATAVDEKATGDMES
jgi:hypothetical protein